VTCRETTDPNLGAAIPFGRSLTYRFAFAGFWSAAAFAGLELPAPLEGWGACKGLLLRHFRWWSDKHDMFNVDGALTIGLTYPNMYMGEDYNSPQSPYWAMKSFVALALPEQHPFWTAEEALPSIAKTLATLVKPAMQVVCNTKHHHFLLSSGQFCPWPLKATEAKYGKFAYSSHFGFSVPTGTLLPQMAPDSTLVLSKDGGDTWRVPWKNLKYGTTTARLLNDGRSVEEIPTLTGIWKPWRDAGIEVHTALIAPCSRWPDWYIRAHKIINNGPAEVNIQAVQGGFAIQGRADGRGGVLPSFAESTALFSTQHGPLHEGTFQSSGGALVCSNAGASGIKHLARDASFGDARSDILKPDANTNLMWQRTLIPTITFEEKAVAAGSQVSFASSVFAMARRAGLEERYDGVDVGARWHDVPEFFVDEAQSRLQGRAQCISFVWEE
jgi:hypothetical protein